MATLTAVALRSPGETGLTFIPPASAQECVSEALPIAVPASPDASPAAVMLPATGNAGLLPNTNATSFLQECPPQAPEPATAEPTLMPTEPAPTPTVTAAPSPTATVTGPGVELPGGGNNSGGLDFPPGTVSY
jgi:hypothetical protein